MRDFSFDLGEVRRRVEEAAAYLKIDESRTRLAELEIEVAKPDLWNDQEHAKRVNTEYSNLKGDIEEFTSLAGAVDDLEVLHEMAREIDDESQEPELESGIATVRAKLDALDLLSLFTGEHDEADHAPRTGAQPPVECIPDAEEHQHDQREVHAATEGLPRPLRLFDGVPVGQELHGDVEPRWRAADRVPTCL